jgi:hypothetical protein
MGYKILGFLVWQGGRLYIRRRFTGMKRKAVVAGLGAAIVAGVLAMQRDTSSSS